MLDFTNQRFGTLTIVRVLKDRSKHGFRMWECLCDCGKIKITENHKLKNNIIKSCGSALCKKNGSEKQNHDGEKYFKYTVLKYVGKNKWRNHLYECQCECGIVKTLILSHLISGKIKSCGCYNRTHKQSLIGSLNPNFNQDITEQQRKIGRNFSTKGLYKWKMNIKKRFNFICQVCQTFSGKNSHAHHLYSYSRYPDLRLDPKNGTCLCANCHRDFHKKFGIKNNTPKQMLQFKKIHKKSMVSHEQN